MVCTIFFALLFFVIVLISAFKLLSEGWNESIRALEKERGDADLAIQLANEWERQPFVSVVSVNATEGCPETHPDQFMWDVWPGTTIMCKCDDG